MSFLKYRLFTLTLGLVFFASASHAGNSQPNQFRISVVDAKEIESMAMPDQSTLNNLKNQVYWDLNSLKVDLDLDGVSDVVKYDSRLKSFSVILSKNPSVTQTFKPDEPSSRLNTYGVRAFALDEKHQYPSLILPMANENGAFLGTAQYILSNSKGVLKLIRLQGVWANARKIECAISSVFSTRTICMVASYPEGASNEDKSLSLSTLLEFKDEKTYRDITREVGLPFGGTTKTRPKKITRTKGLYGIGASFVDYNKDGLIDLTYIAQHSKILVAKMKRDSSVKAGFKYDYKWIDKGNEYYSLSAPSYSGLPCSYVVMELKETKDPNFLKCFDASKNEYVNYLLPAPLNNAKYTVHYQLLPFVKVGNDHYLSVPVREANNSNGYALVKIVDTRLPVATPVASAIVPPKPAAAPAPKAPAVAAPTTPAAQQRVPATPAKPILQPFSGGLMGLIKNRTAPAVPPRGQVHK